jgi:hypothetical protein
VNIGRCDVMNENGVAVVRRADPVIAISHELLAELDIADDYSVSFGTLGYGLGVVKYMIGDDLIGEFAVQCVRSMVFNGLRVVPQCTACRQGAGNDCQHFTAR